MKKEYQNIKNAEWEYTTNGECKLITPKKEQVDLTKVNIEDGATLLQSHKTGGWWLVDPKEKGIPVQYQTEGYNSNNAYSFSEVTPHEPQQLTGLAYLIKKRAAS